jgi:hypothetical protein
MGHFTGFKLSFFRSGSASKYLSSICRMCTKSRGTLAVAQIIKDILRFIQAGINIGISLIADAGNLVGRGNKLAHHGKPVDYFSVIFYIQRGGGNGYQVAQKGCTSGTLQFILPGQILGDSDLIDSFTALI